MTQINTNPLDDDLRWQAVLGRDGSLDGRFVYAVKTTGIYCRPSCPSRQSKRKNTVFFSNPAAATEAGYRECQRCRPNGPNADERCLAAVRSACSAIETAEKMPELDQLAAHVGLSPSYLHRQFKKVVGVTPRQYASRKRLERFQEGLGESATVTTAIYDAGFGSGSRVYESARHTLGMTPGEYRAGGRGLRIEFTLAKSDLGLLLVAATEQGVCCIEIGSERKTLCASLRERFPAAQLSENDEGLRDCVQEITRYVRTPTTGLDLPLDIQGTAFQQRVWKALQDIPRGETASYSDVAAAIGKPTAHRAVASACAANKLALAVPCHRVVRTDGKLGGYRWGLQRKQQLLDNEKSSRNDDA